MFGKRSQHQGELTIPPIAARDPAGKEIVRGWVADGGLHVSLELAWPDSAAWGVALADLTRHLADAYHSSAGIDKEETIKRIVDLFQAELGSPTDTPSGQLVN